MSMIYPLRQNLSTRQEAENDGEVGTGPDFYMFFDRFRESTRAEQAENHKQIDWARRRVESWFDKNNGEMGTPHTDLARTDLGGRNTGQSSGASITS